MLMSGPVTLAPLSACIEIVQNVTVVDELTPVRLVQGTLQPGQIIRRFGLFFLKQFVQ